MYIFLKGLGHEIIIGLKCYGLIGFSQEGVSQIFIISFTVSFNFILRKVLDVK